MPQQPKEFASKALEYIAARVASAGERGCTLWTGTKQSAGYPHAKIGGKVYTATRLQWELLRGPIPDGMLICHHCDTPPCMNIEHHFLGTYQDNVTDMDQKGRRNQVRGESHGRRRLSEAQVTEIRSAASAGERVTKIAIRFGVSHTTISDIISGRRWAHPDHTGGSAAA